MRRFGIAVVAIVAAWFVVVFALLIPYFVIGFNPADLIARIAAPGTPVNGVLNALWLLIPEFFLARWMYRRLCYGPDGRR